MIGNIYDIRRFIDLDHTYIANHILWFSANATTK